jgi:hypothetical protein
VKGIPQAQQELMTLKNEESAKLFLSFIASKAGPSKEFVLYGLWPWDLFGASAMK